MELLDQFNSKQKALREVKMECLTDVIDSSVAAYLMKNDKRKSDEDAIFG